MDQSIPGFIWTFYVIVPLAGMLVTVVTMMILSRKDKRSGEVK
ncbi:hypothetical protein [Pseudalkalibacillus decolorationis]|nr:hypothetical protein [Pseudalkalibacillus decolorationis]